MAKEQENIKIEQEDLSFVEKELSQSAAPLSLQELTKKLVYKKTSSQLAQQVKVYDPYCRYEIGDYIYKEYDESLTVSSKGAEHFNDAVVLRVVNKFDYQSFNCEMLEVDYSGGGIFRKHIDYMKKTKTQVLLPSNLEKKGEEPQVLKKEDDPRHEHLPMTERDMKKLEKNLKSALSKSSQFFHWDDYWQLKEKKIKIGEKKIKDIENYLQEKKQSIPTEELVSKFFRLKPDQEQFPLYCVSLNHILEKKYKKIFVYASPQNWGKWTLKQILNSFLKGLPLSAPRANLPSLERETGKKTSSRDYPLKIYLTWREILSGGVKVPKSHKKDFSISREYVFTDVESEKDHTVYYYPSAHLFIGLKEFYQSNNVPQGASLSLEKKNALHFNFWLKKSKKKLSVAKINYKPKEDKFTDSGEEVFTFSLPNKIIHLQKETLTKLFSLYNQRNGLDLRELLILIYKNFGLGRDNSSLHYLRAYHLVDLLRQTTQEDVEKILTHSPEFKKSEKKKGIFLYQEKIRIEEEEKEAEAPPEIPPQEEAEEVPPEAPPEEISPPPLQEKREEIRAEAPARAQKVEIEEPSPEEQPPPPKKEKEPKKKREKVRPEREKTLRMRKGEKRFIEEKIEIEESEQEALFAVKAKEKKTEEEEKTAPPSKKKKEYKHYVSEEPVFGIFAEKLKSALDKKGSQKKEEEEKEK
ncbi:MAG: hypothetical protein ACLFVG_00595 [Candidatus Aminicenantes bacterium]